MGELAIEAKLVFACNDTAKYIENLDSEERRKFVLSSRADTPTLRKKFKERQLALKQAAEDALQARKDKALADEQKRIYELIDLTVKVNGVGGLWNSSLDVDAGLTRVKGDARGSGKGKLLEALKSQLSFRKKVLKQQISDAKLWSYSEKGRAFDVAELSSRLKLIIAECPIPSLALSTTTPPDNTS